MFGMKKKEAAPATAPVTAPASEPSTADSGATQYSGFWLRVLAAFADSAILLALTIVIAIASSFAGEMGAAIGFAASALLPLLYFPIMHASQRQATFGKAMLGIMVTDAGGDRISMLRSFGRELAKIISAIPLGIGFLMAAFTGRNQALHDMIASTLVVRDGDTHIARTIVVAIVGYAVPMIAIPLFGMAIVTGMLASVMGDMMGEMKKPPASAPSIAAKPAAPKPATPVPAPATTPAAAPASAGPSPAAAPAAPAGKADAGKAAAKAEPASAPEAAPAPLPQIAVPPPGGGEIKATPRRRTARVPAAPTADASPPAAADTPIAGQTGRLGPAPKPCEIKPVMTDDEINICRIR